MATPWMITSIDIAIGGTSVGSLLFNEGPAQLEATATATGININIPTTIKFQALLSSRNAAREVRHLKIGAAPTGPTDRRDRRWIAAIALAHAATLVSHNTKILRRFRDCG